jgi:hypothetical protein
MGSDSFSLRAERARLLNGLLEGILSLVLGFSVVVDWRRELRQN